MSSRLLNLYRVLEEEYERLHRESPPSLEPHSKAEIRLKNIIKDIHTQEHTAICLSGGGIRSATFGLGVLQALARNQLLNKFSYLSTVSGGGCVGGWLSAWIHRHPEGLDGVIRELPSEKPHTLLNPEPEPISHLRSYSNYLTPRLGLLSADTWTLVAIVARNLVLNWLVLVPLMIAALALPRLFVSLSQLSPPSPIRVAALALGFLSSLMMIVYVAIKRPSITKRRADRKNFIRWCLAPLLISATFLAWYWAWASHANDLSLEKSLTSHLLDKRHPVFGFILFGVGLQLLAWVLYSLILRRFQGSTPWRELFALALNGVVGGVSLWLVATKLFPSPTFIEPASSHGFQIQKILAYATLSAPMYLLLIMLGLTLFAGLSSQWTEDEDREWWARFGGWVFIVIAVWMLASFLVLLGPPLLIQAWVIYVMPAGGVIGVVTALLGRSAKSPAKDKPEEGPWWRILLMRYALPLGAVIFAAVLIVFLSLVTNYLIDVLSIFLNWVLSQFHWSAHWLHNETIDLNGTNVLLSQTAFTSVASRLIFASSRQILILIGATGLLGLWIARQINTNKFSHHAMYRNRLIRAYLGASRKDTDRDPDPFTGFDPDDNLSMHELRPELFHSGSFQNLNGFIDRLKSDPPDPVSAYLLSDVISSDTKEFLERYDPSHALSKGRYARKLLQRALNHDLNTALLSGVPLRDVPGFSHLESPMSPDPNDKVPLEALVLDNRRLLEAAYPDEIRPCAKPPQLPLHVVNMTLNLVHGDRLAWQQRKAESFTVSPLHCGSFQIPDTDEGKPLLYGSYRRTREYGGLARGKDPAGISLGTAVAISGAAVSPNMGYYSSPVVTFLMTLFNVRLGWWLGNPGPPGEDCYRLAYPRSAVYPIVAEMLGLTDDKNKYIYLSDGGHFENLGLYEMVLRRCHTIVISDASDDGEFQFDNLGNAVRKIRTDFGIPIEFEPMHILPRKDKKKGAYCAIGTIRYSLVDEVDKVNDMGEKILDLEKNPVQIPAEDGTIIYIKPIFYGDEPRDIYHYAMTHKTFPHESTINQWFSEAQFESYRMLGSWIVDRICHRMQNPTLVEFLEKSRANSQAPAEG